MYTEIEGPEYKSQFFTSYQPAIRKLHPHINIFTYTSIIICLFDDS